MNRLCPRCGDMVAGACPRCAPRSPSPRKQLLHLVYRSSRFKALRLVCFARDGWTCVDCGYIDETRTGAGLVADHVLGFDGPDDPNAWDIDNLATRCPVCSGRKDGRRRRPGF